MSQDFSKAKIYKITNDFNDDVYVGSTCDTLIKRFSSHKNNSKKECKKNYLLYRLTNEIGFERFRIDLIEDYPCEDKQTLRFREGYWIRQIGTLNKKIEGRTKQEYNKEYYDENKEKKKKYYKEYYDENKECILKKTTCDCGCILRKADLNRHRKSKKHNDLICQINA
jgi:group I intron endonuclease